MLAHWAEHLAQAYRMYGLHWSIELHLIYNTLVFAPMIVAMYRHRFPAAAEARTMRCSCAGYAVEAA